MHKNCKLSKTGKEARMKSNGSNNEMNCPVIIMHHAFRILFGKHWKIFGNPKNKKSRLETNSNVAKQKNTCA